jgi:protocatechuate 3,4-dioxygenase beta subunit
MFTVLLLWVHALLAQEQWRIVDGRGAVHELRGTPQLSASQRQEVRSAWVWSGLSAPRKVAPERIGRERLKDDSARLEVRVVRRGSSAAGLRLIAAPAEMWGEIPEASLPSWPLPKGGRLAIPLDPARAWRLRVAGRGEGSWWMEVRPGQRAVLLTSKAAMGIEVAVLDPEGRPSGAVHASLQESFARAGGLRTWAGVRSENGRIEVPGLADEQEIAVAIHHALGAPLVLRGLPSALPRQVRLSPAAQLRGRVFGGPGAPLAGAAVEAEAWTTSETPQVYRVRTASDEKGAWRLGGLPPGKIALTLRAPGFVPLLETFEAEPGEKDLGVRTLAAGTSLEVLVVDDQGAPVPGARVVANQGLSQATADGRGVARLSGLPLAPVQLRGKAERHLSGQARLNPPFPADARLVLDRALTLMGRLVDAAGAPAGGGSVRVESGTCQSGDLLGLDGRFELDIPPATLGELVLRSPGTRELRLPLSPGEPGEVRDLGDLKGPPSLVAAGRVTTEDGAPLPGARVWTTRQGSDGPAVAWSTGDLLQAVTDEEGRFLLAGLVPGAPAVIRVEAAGFARAQLALPLGSAEDEGLVDLGTVILTGGAEVRVRLDSRDVPATGAVARVDLANRWLDADFLSAAVVDGQALIPNVPAGRVTVSVVAGRQLLCEQTAEVPPGGDLDVDCRRPVRVVAGQVLSGGVPAGAGILSWQIPSGVPARIDNLVSPAGLRQQQLAGLGRPQVDVEVGDDGRFQSSDLSPGRWQVAWRTREGATAGEIAVEIPQGERVELVLPFAGLGVAGQVVGSDGRPAAGARVREMGSGALALTDADGRFSLAGLEAGKAVLQAQLGGQTSPLEAIELQPGREPGPVILVLGEPRPPVVKAGVVDAQGAPVAGAYVFLEEEGKGQRLVITAADGLARVTLEPPLPNRVRVAAFAAGAWAFGPWRSLEEARQGLALELTGGGELRLETGKPEGSPRILTQDGWDLSWLLRQLGAPPVVAAERPFHLSGLPAGDYSIFLDGASLTLSVGRGRPAEGRL